MAKEKPLGPLMGQKMAMPLPPSEYEQVAEALRVKVLRKFEEKIDTQFVDTMELLQIFGAIGSRW